VALKSLAQHRVERHIAQVRIPHAGNENYPVVSIVEYRPQAGIALTPLKELC
jgi:hypothetical protein